MRLDHPAQEVQRERAGGVEVGVRAPHVVDRRRAAQQAVVVGRVVHVVPEGEPQCPHQAQRPLARLLRDGSAGRAESGGLGQAVQSGSRGLGPEQVPGPVAPLRVGEQRARVTAVVRPRPLRAVGQANGASRGVRQVLPHGHVAQRVGNERAGEGVAHGVRGRHGTVLGRSAPADHEVDPVVLGQARQALATLEPRPGLPLVDQPDGAVPQRQLEEAGFAVHVEAVGGVLGARTRKVVLLGHAVRGRVVVHERRHPVEMAALVLEVLRVLGGVVRGTPDLLPAQRADDGPGDHVAVPVRCDVVGVGRQAGLARDPVTLGDTGTADGVDGARRAGGRAEHRLAAVCPDRQAGTVRQLARQVEVAVPGEGDRQHDRCALRESFPCHVGRDQFHELVDVQFERRVVRQPCVHPVVPSVGGHDVRGRALRPGCRRRVEDVVRAGRGVLQYVAPGGVELRDGIVLPVEARYAAALDGEVAGAARRQHAQLGEVEGPQCGEARRRACGRGPFHQREQFRAKVRSGASVGVQVQYAAGERVHVQRTVAQRGLPAAQGVQRLHRGRVGRLGDTDRGLPAQLGPGHTVERTRAHPVTGGPCQAFRPDREVRGGQTRFAGGAVLLEVVQRTGQQPLEQGAGGLRAPPARRGLLADVRRAVRPARVGAVAGDGDARQ